MTNTESYIRLSLGGIIVGVAVYAQLWYLFIFSGILFYTAYKKFCLMFSILGINKKLSIENYFHALLPKYSPYASYIFNAKGEVLFRNKAAEESFSDVTTAEEFGILEPKTFIAADTVSNKLFEYRGETFQLNLFGISKEDILLIHFNNITQVMDLEYINSNLQNEVAHALIDNRLKNHLLAQQSKLATTGELIENITHQWKQPLNALAILLQNMELQKALGSLDEQTIEGTMQDGMKLVHIMAKTVDDFRNFFKVDKKRSVFFVASCLDDVLLILGSSLRKAAIKVNNDIDPAIKIKGFRNEFTQVILNIINNAKDAFSESQAADPLINIDTRLTQDTVILTISDNAGGIAKEHLPKIFDSHFTTKEHKDGTGIGLHMSKIIIEEDMKGLLRADNHGNGARFIIELPLAGEVSS